MDLITITIDQKKEKSVMTSVSEMFKELETQAEKLKEVVLENVQNYSVDTILDTGDAKKKRAELNRAKDNLNALRLDLQKRYNEPFSLFRIKIDESIEVIKGATTKIDDIVREQEAKEKADKKAMIEEYWRSKDFSIMDLSQIFNEKWLNKTYSQKDIFSEIDAKILQVSNDLKTIEAFGVDVETVKAFYLASLDIGKAIAEATRLKELKEIAESEAETRASREHKETIDKLQREVIAEEKEIEKNQTSCSLASMALGIEPEEKLFSFAVRFSCTQAQRVALKQWLLDNNITYSNLT